jgi:hypothetical protein
MTTPDIILAGFQIPDEGWDLFTKIQHAISKLVDADSRGHLNIMQYDLASYELKPEEQDSSWVYVFGEVAQKSIGKVNYFIPMPDLRHACNNPDARKQANLTLKESIPLLINYLDKKVTPEKKVEVHVETPTNLTVGTTGCDFCVTEKEAEYLKKILDILGGGKMVITKGDLRIEVER